MIIDFSLFVVSMVFALLGLLLEDITSMGIEWMAVFRYLPLLVIYIKHFRKDFSSFIPLLFSLFLFSLSFLRGHYSMSGMLSTIMLPVVLFVYTKVRFSRRQISIIALLVLASLFLYYIISLVRRHSINPNQIAFKILILTVIYFFCVHTNDRRKRIVIHTLYDRKRTIGAPGFILLFTISFFLILFTKSRNSLLVYLMLAAAFVVRERVAKWNVWGLLMFGLLVLYFVYPFVYCLLSDSFKGTADTEMMGQDVFSGREYIWASIFAQLTDSSHFLFGGIDTDWWGKSMHNSAIDIVVRYGVPAAVIIELIIFYYFKKVCLMCNNHYRPLLLLIITTMIWGLNESGLFLRLSYFLYFPYCILLSKNKGVGQQIKKISQNTLR